MKRVAICVFTCLSLMPAVWADPAMEALTALTQQVQQLSLTVEQLTTTVASQQQRMTELEGANRQFAQQAGSTVPPAAARPASGGANLSAFNPEIGVLVDVVGQLSESSADGEGNDKISAREMELVFGHPIDPYSRLDATASFSDFEAANLEEAYITHWGLPWEIRGRLGRLKPKIGKAVAIHRDSLDTVDEPLVVQKYLGAEGLSRTSVELSGFLPAPWTAVTHELTGGVMEGGVGEGGTLFGGIRRRPSFYAHLKNFWDITETTNLELGGTYLTGSKDADASFEVNALGLDATLVHYVTPANKLKWQNELYLQDRDEAFSVAEDGMRTDFAGQPWGLYTLLDYRLSPRLGVGGRFDYVELVDTNPTLLVRHADTAWSGYLTFYQSEFARWRLQLRHTNFAQGGDDNTIFLQGTVAIGVHKHQLQ